MKAGSFVKLALSNTSRVVVTTPGGLIQEFNVLYRALHTLRDKINDLKGDLVLFSPTTIPPLSLVRVNSLGEIELANNTALNKRAIGYSTLGGSGGNFVEAAFKSFFVEGLSGLIPGSIYYLASTPGEMTLVPPVSSGSIIQEVGTALTSSDFLVQITAPILIP